MVMMETTLSGLNDHLGRKLSVEQLKEALFNIGFELEDVVGDELRIDVTPDRPDAISTQGLANVLSAYLGFSKSFNEHKVKKSGVVVKVKPEVNKVRPYTVCAVVKKLKLDDQRLKEIIRVQEKLHATFGRHRKKAAIGIYPLSEIKPPIVYTAMKPSDIKFVPLDAEKEMNGRQILELHEKGKDYAHLLSTAEKYPVFLDANGNFLSMPPIINSENVGRVVEDTEDVFIECSGTDLPSLEIVLNILVVMLADMGGEVYSVDVEYQGKKLVTPALTPQKRTLKVSEVNKLLGLELKAQDIARLLAKMMYRVKSSKDAVVVEIPAVRCDIWHDVDIIDDVARAYGFNNFELSLKPVQSTAETTASVKMKDQINELMIGLGFQEVMTLALTSTDDQFKHMNIDEQSHVGLKGSAEQGLNMVRVWLLPELMKCLMHNQSKEYPQRIFEVSFVVHKDDKADVKSRNALRFSAVIAHEKADFTEAKQVLHYVLKNLGFAYHIEDVGHGSFIPGRCGRVFVDKKPVAFIGEIAPEVLSSLGLEVPVAGFELELNELLGL